MMSTPVSSFIDNDGILTKLRTMVTKFMDLGEYRTASFWCNKVLSFPYFDSKDVYVQSKCFYHLREYHRATHCIKSRNLHKTDLACRHLAAKCHYTAQEYKEALEVLDCVEDETAKKINFIDSELLEDNKLSSAICLLKGHIHEALDNRGEAAEWFKKALRTDTYCYEALYSLVQHQMLTRQEEEELLSEIISENNYSKSENCLLEFLYESQLEKYSKPSELEIPKNLEGLLGENVDVLTSLAERHYYNCDFNKCLQITTKVLEKDIYHSQCLPIHLSCLMELKKTNVIFDLGHKLVDLYPESATSWYAVGCYYLMINKTDAARRFLSKSTNLDNVFGPAWLLYGHSFAIESEHDQAMAAYFKAYHLMKGCHLPLLYIGLEYGLTDNTKLAEKFFNQALLIAPDDPFVIHELGVIEFHNQDFNMAEEHFKSALSLIKHKRDITCLPEKWEPLLNNMGHVLRKLKRYEEALEYHRQALVLSPLNPSTYSAIGYVYMLMWKWKQAVDYFHKALGLKRDDQCANNMLRISMEHLVQEISLVDDSVPIYENSNYVSKFLTSNLVLEESSIDYQLIDDNLFEKSLSENEAEIETSGLDEEMELSP